MSTAHDWKRIDLDWYKCAACGNQISALADYALTKYGCKGMPGTGGPVPPLSAKEKLTSLTRQDWEMIGLKATVAQQAQMIEHLRGGPTPLYTAVDMANAAAGGFRDGLAAFSADGMRNVLAEVFFQQGDDTFICAVRGRICVEQLEAAQRDFRENLPDELEKGDGIYTFDFFYEKGQYDEWGRCEIAPGWGFDFVSYKAFEAEEVQA